MCRAAAYPAQRTGAAVDYVEAALNRSGSLQQLPGSVDHDMHEMEEQQQREMQGRQHQHNPQQQQQQPQQPSRTPQQPGFGPSQSASLGEVVVWQLVLMHRINDVMQQQQW